MAEAGDARGCCETAMGAPDGDRSGNTMGSRTAGLYHPPPVGGYHALAIYMASYGDTYTPSSPTLTYKQRQIDDGSMSVSRTTPTWLLDLQSRGLGNRDGGRGCSATGTKTCYLLCAYSTLVCSTLPGFAHRHFIHVPIIYNYVVAVKESCTWGTRYASARSVCACASHPGQSICRGPPRSLTRRVSIIDTRTP